MSHCSNCHSITAAAGAAAAVAGGVHYYHNIYRHQEKVDVKGKYVVITGCDSGFGRALAVALSDMGVSVVAACLTAEGMDSLSTQDERIYVTLCDVTKAADVAGLYARVKDVVGESGVWALVNNAGIGDGGRIDLGIIEKMKKTVEINLIGTMAVTHAFVPLLRKAKGRLINIASIAGRITAPGMSAYCASKWGVEAFSDCIRPELKQWGIDVVIIEPSFFQTNIIADLDKKVMETWNAMDLETKTLFGEKYLKETRNRLKELKGENPSIVVGELINAVTSRVPKRRYIIGKSAKVLIYLSYLPSAIQDIFFGLSLLTPEKAVSRL